MNEYVPLEWPEGQNLMLSGFGEGFPDALVGALNFSLTVRDAYSAQAAYRIAVEGAGGTPVWDSGWVESAQSNAIPYAGTALEPDRDYVAWAQVRTTDGIETPLSQPLRFSTGLESGTWPSLWICQPVAVSAAPIFRREFEAGWDLVRARLFIAGLGYFEARLNGKKVGDHRMESAWTVYDKRVSYVAYDVLSQVKPGRNALGVMLGGGWYATKEFRRPIMTALLRLEYRDGSKKEIMTESDGWKFFADGPIQSDSIYIGEVYDARREVSGWDEPGFDDRGWVRPLEAEPPRGVLSPQRCEPIRIVQSLAPQKITSPALGVHVVDFGQNMAGVLWLSGEANRGDEIRIRYSEILSPDGNVNMLNLRAAQQTDRYIAAGGAFSYEPRFTYHGFRYAEITGLKAPLSPDQVEALVVRNDVRVRGGFSCSNELINDIQRICFWTECNNLHWVPTDCPQRDERLGWLNDLTVRAEEAMYNFDLRSFYDKFLTDIRDAQGEATGAITDTVPYTKYGGQPADGVCSSYLVLAWLLYMHYGDEGVLARYYDGLKAWTDYMARQREKGIVAYSYYGDWASPITESVKGSYGSGAVSGTTPGRLMSTGFLLMNARLIKQMAEALGKVEDRARYEALEGETLEALNREYLDRERGQYATGSQAANAFMLYLNVVPDDVRTSVVESLVRDIRARGVHLSTGNLCTRYIFEVLCDNGQEDLAFELATQRTYPSWGYMLSRGATTTWERWEYVDSGELLGMASHDHPMYATISAWFYRYLAGIQPLAPGFDRFLVRPFMPRGLDEVSARLCTVKGEIRAGWTRNGSGATVRIDVPFGSVCDAQLPVPQGLKSVRVNEQSVSSGAAVGGRVHIPLKSGTYEIVLSW
jgi:alpha-L-rhamnosidase